MAGCSSSPKGAEVVSWDPDTQISVPKNLKKSLIAYWAARARLDWPTIYKLEAPHVRWLYTQGEFVRFRQRAAKVISVKVFDVNEIDSRVKSIGLETKLINSRTGEVETFYPHDRWIEVKGHWFHVWKNMLQRNI